MVTKINVSISADVLDKVDKAARKISVTRSAFLTQAVNHYLEEMEEAEKLERRRQAAAEIDRIRKELGPWDATAEVLKWRDLH